MNPFLSAIAPKLQAAGVSDDQFQLLLGRLLDFGVLNRSHSQVEQQHYDVYVRVPELVADYFACVGVRLLHESRFESLRLIPPGAQVPGVEDESSPFNGGMRAKLNQQEIAIVLTLRCEYEKCLREGRVDEQGAVMVSLENLALAIKQLLGRSLPDNISERRLQLRRLRQLRVIEIPNDEKWQEQDEPWLLVRPAIVSLVSDDVLNSLMADQTEAEDLAAPVEEAPEDETSPDVEPDNDEIVEAVETVELEALVSAPASTELGDSDENPVESASDEKTAEEKPKEENQSSSVIEEKVAEEAIEEICEDTVENIVEPKEEPATPKKKATQRSAPKEPPSVAASFPSDLFADMDDSLGES